MKFKNIFFSLLGGMLIGACTPNEADVYLNPVKPADIKILELMADHETLLPDGEAEMNFRIMAYGIKEIKVMKKYETSDAFPIRKYWIRWFIKSPTMNYRQVIWLYMMNKVIKSRTTFFPLPVQTGMCCVFMHKGEI